MMSSKAKVVEFKCLDADGIRREFAPVFELDPTLEPGTFFQILRDEDFSYTRAHLKVWERVKKPNQFIIPVTSNSPTPDGVSKSQLIQSIEEASAIGSNRKRSAAQFPIEASEDEEEEPVRPLQRRRAPALSVRLARNPALSKSVRVSTSQKSGSKKLTQAQAANYFQSTSVQDSSEDEIESLTPIPKPTSNHSSFRTAKSSDNELSDDFESNSDEESETLSDSSDDLASLKHKNNKSAPSPPGRTGNPNDWVLKNEVKTKATPWMNKLAGAYFAKSLEEAPDSDLNDLEPEREDKEALRDLTAHLEVVREQAWDHTVEDIKFEGPSIWDDRTGRSGYASARVDGQLYQAGDCVILRADSSGNKTKGKGSSTQSDEGETDVLPDPRYARVVYLFEDEYGTAMAHFRWFEHGAKTVLGSLAGPYELFLLTQCDDSPLSSIASKIEVENLSGDHHRGVVEEDFLGNGHYFYRFHWHPRNETFTNASMHEANEGEAWGAHRCDCCVRRAQRKEQGKIKVIRSTVDEGRNQRLEGFRSGGIEYFLNDFVYIFNDPEIPYQLGQIVQIKTAQRDLVSSPRSRVKENTLMIKVELYKRYDRFHKSYFEEFQDSQQHAVRDERRLYKTCRTKRIWADQIDGKFHLRHRQHINGLEEYKNQDDTFWVAEQVSDKVDPKGEIRPRDLVRLSPKDLRYSKQTLTDQAAQKQRLDNYLKKGKKLRTLDIFSGMGGLSMGMHLSGAIETLWAFEYSEAACRTYKQNFPKAKVYNVDANILLNRVIRRENGEELEPLKDWNGDLIPDLPLRGEVDLILGGPPCQGYSLANRLKKADSIKNSMIVLYLSFLEFYQPKYSLLENVRGLLTHRLGATQLDKHNTVGGIERGTLKFILRALTSLGYQTEFNVLQAAEHNTPQCRQRVIFWASKLGHPLPVFPQPNNVVESRISPLSWARVRRSAPHKKITVGDALSDLPAFNWINPHGVIPKTRQDRVSRERRWETITQYNVDGTKEYVGRNRQSYASRPVSEFQRKLRIGVSNDKLLNHVTTYWRDETTERVCNVAMWPGADHRTMPDILKMNFLTSATAAKHNFYPGRFGRLDMNGLFQTCMTDMNPSGKNGKVLHPTQHRVVSIREYARAMGIPDWFIFDLENSRMKDIIRQIGNSVPVPLGTALGLELRNILIDEHEEAQQRLVVVKEEGTTDGHELIGNWKGSKNDPISLEDSSDDEMMVVS